MALSRRARKALTAAMASTSLIWPMAGSASARPLGPSVAPASTAAQQLMARAVAATQGTSGFSIVTVESSSTRRLTMRTHAGTYQGAQSIVMTGVHGTERLSVLVKGPTAYFRGNEAALSDYMRFTPAAAASETDKWIGATSASSSKLEVYFFQSVAAGLTVASASRQLQLPGTLSLGPDTTFEGLRVHDIRTVLVHGKQSARGDLYLRATGKPLPVHEALTASTGVRVSLDISGWGRQPLVHAPRQFVPVELGWLSRAWAG